MCADKHLHIVIWAAEGKSETGFTGVTYIDVIAFDVDDALEQAKGLVPGRKYYWVNNVILHHGHEIDGKLG